MTGTQETLKIERSRLIEYEFKNSRGNRCAIGWWLHARGASLPEAFDNYDAFAKQNRDVFADVIRKLGSDVLFLEWQDRVMNANNFHRGRVREARLRDLFAQVGVRLVFHGRTNP